MTQRRVEAEARARAQIDAQRRAILRQHAVALVETLDRIMIRGRAFVLDTFAALACPHVWACDADGLVIGHVLTVSDETLELAALMDRVIVLPLADALARIWQADDERHAWSGAYVEALRRIADDEEAMERALTERAELLRMVDRDGDGG